MSLKFKAVDLPFGGGLDDKTQDQLLQGPKLDGIQNLRFRKSGALERRPDYVQHGSPGTDTLKVLEYKDTLVAIHKGGAAQLVDHENATINWNELGTPGPRPYGVERRNVLISEESAAQAYSSVHGGYIAHVWSRGGDGQSDVWLRVDDADTGAILHGPEIIPLLNTADHGAYAGADPDKYWTDLSGLQIHPITYQGSIQWAILCIAQDPTVSTQLSCTIVRATDSGVTVGTPTGLSHVTYGGVVGSRDAIGYSDPASEVVYVVDGTGTGVARYLNRITLSAAGMVGTVESTAFLTDMERQLGVFVHPDQGYVHAYGMLTEQGDDPPTPEDLHYWPENDSSLPATISASLLHHSSGVELEAGSCAAACARPDGTAVVVYDGSSNPDSSPGVRWVELNTSGYPVAGGGDDRDIYNAALHAHPWSDEDGQVTIPLVSINEYETTYPAGAYWVGGTLAREARQHASLAEVVSKTSSQARRVAVHQIDVGRRFYGVKVPRTERRRSNAGPYVFGSMVNIVGTSDGDNVFPTDNAAYSLFRADDHAADTASNDVAILSCGYLSQIDGTRHSEVMQAQPPAVVFIDYLEKRRDVDEPGGDEGHSFAVRFVWAWRDAQGNIHRSAPSDEYTAIADAAVNPGPITQEYYLSCKISVPPFLDEDWLDGALPTDVFLEAYSHMYGNVNDQNRSDTLYMSQMDIGSNSKNKWRLSELIDPAAPWYTVRITVRESNEANVALYTNPIGSGPLEHDPMPCPLHVATTRERVWMIDSENRDTVWVSAPSAPYNAPEFSAATTVRIPNESGELTALGAIGDLVVFFGERSIHAMEAIGGPNSLGRGQFAPVRLVSREVGCVNKASVLTTDIGILFESQHGIALINQSQQVDRAIGRDVRLAMQAKRDAGESIVSASVIAKDSQAIFDWSDGTSFVLDYEQGEWSIFTHEYQTITGCRFENTHAIVNVVGNALISDESAVDEAVECEFTTGWIRLAGVQGYKRVRRVGLLGRVLGVGPSEPYPGPMDLGTINLRVYYNDDENDYFDYVGRDLFTMYNAGGIDPLQLKWHLHDRQKLMSIKFRFTYALGGGQYEWPLKPEFSGVSLELGLKRGIHRISQTRGTP